jgi:hypothetical protein
MDQTAACKHLLASVIVTAVKDACSKSEYLHGSALHFLFFDPPAERLDLFLDFLDIDTGHFRLALLRFMDSPEMKKSRFPFTGISQKEKSRFKTNYAKWNEQKKFNKGKVDE